MRGTEERSGSLFSYVDLETRVPKDAPAAGDLRDCEWGAVGPDCGLCGDVRATGAALDPAGEGAAGIAVAGVLHDPLGAPTDGTAGV